MTKVPDKPANPHLEEVLRLAETHVKASIAEARKRGDIESTLLQTSRLAKVKQKLREYNP